MRDPTYPSDVTNEQWALIAPLIPVYPGGRPRTTDVRDVLDAILYVLRTGCQWRYLPKDFPPRSTVWRYFDEWRHNGTLDLIHDRLRTKCRTREKPGQPRTTSSEAATTPKMWTAASVISSWTVWACCWRCW
jgi:putative transposase